MPPTPPTPSTPAQWAHVVEAGRVKNNSRAHRWGQSEAPTDHRRPPAGPRGLRAAAWAPERRPVTGGTCSQREEPLDSDYDDDHEDHDDHHHHDLSVRRLKRRANKPTCLNCLIPVSVSATQDDDDYV